MKPKLRQMTRDIPFDVQIYIYYGKSFKYVCIITTSMNHLKRIKFTKLKKSSGKYETYGHHCVQRGLRKKNPTIVHSLIP